jgi:hypothetical protein
MLNTKSNTKHKPMFVTDVAPENKVKYKSKETFSQTLMNYEVIRDKVQTDFKPRSTPEIADGKKPGGKKKLINF